jgi:hypothetical protein
MIFENLASTKLPGEGNHEGVLPQIMHLTGWVACPYEIPYCPLEVSRGR